MKFNKYQKNIKLKKVMELKLHKIFIYGIEMSNLYSMVPKLAKKFKK
jgi:hypothetical protein